MAPFFYARNPPDICHGESLNLYFPPACLDMIMLPRYLFALCSLCYVCAAQAEIYKRVDADGHVTYSSTPLKGSKKLHLAPLPTLAPPRVRRTEADDFPRVDAATQKDRDNTRRQILEDELAAEEKALAEARTNLQESAENPGTRGSKAAQGSEASQVQTHEKNIEALRIELTKLNK